MKTSNKDMNQKLAEFHWVSCNGISHLLLGISMTFHPSHYFQNQVLPH